MSPSRKRPRAAKSRRGQRISRPRQPRATTALTAAPVSAAELRALRRELEQRLGKPATRRALKKASGGREAPARWNPNPEEVQKSVAQLVLTIVEFLRQLMERQAIRRMEQRTLSDEQIEAVGAALMQLERTIRDIGKRFGLTPEELNLDLGSIKLM